MAKQTPLYPQHESAGARIVDFAGWDMPIHYGSQLDEHHAVRRHAGLFDVSHMCQVDITGPGAVPFLQHVFANNVARMVDGQALYGCLLNEQGGVIDDGIVYRFDDDDYRLVVNAGTRDKDVQWLQQQAEGFDVSLREREDLAMIAAQGPQARDIAAAVLPSELAEQAGALGRFQMTPRADIVVARTGYTGEDGYEIMLPAEDAPRYWDALVGAGATPAGLGARDTLRLEAGMALYGHEMDESVSPLEAGLGWTIAWEPADRAFVGRSALESQRAAGVGQRLVGLVLEGRGIARDGQKVLTSAGEGVVTSGGFSPTLERSIALARVPANTSGQVDIEIRGRPVPARVVKYPFVRDGKSRIDG